MERISIQMIESFLRIKMAKTFYRVVHESRRGSPMGPDSKSVDHHVFVISGFFDGTSLNIEKKVEVASQVNLYLFSRLISARLTIV